MGYEKTMTASDSFLNLHDFDDWLKTKHEETDQIFMKGDHRKVIV